MELLILLFGIFYTILAYKHLDWAMMVLIAGLPTYLIRFQVFGTPFTVLELMILISFVVWVMFYTKFSDFVKRKYSWQDIKANRAKRLKYPFRWEIVLMLFISWIAIAVAGFSDAAMGVWKAYFFEPALVFILVLNVFRTNTKETNINENIRPPSQKLWRVKMARIERILWPLAMSALIVSLVAIYQKVTGQLAVPEFWPRATGVFPYPNALGLYLGPLVIAFFGWLVDKIKSKEKWVMSYELWIIGLIIILSLVAIFLAKSEGALVAIAGALVVFGLLAGKRIRWVTIALVIIASLGIGLYQPAREYAVKKITLRDLSGEIRKQQWRETWEMLASSPRLFILGTGLAKYQVSILPFHQEGIFFNSDNDPEFHRHVVWDEEYHKAHWQPVEIYMYPHNILLNFWTELGLVGALLFIWIVGKYFLIGWQEVRRGCNNFQDVKNENCRYSYLTFGLMGAMIVIIVHGIVDVPYFKNDLAVMFWVFIAMLCLINLSAKQSKEAQR